MTVVLDVKDLSVGTAHLQLLRGVTLALHRGERLGLVGESGSGKSLTALSIMRLLELPAKITGGSISIDGNDLTGISRRALNGFRGRRIAMIYQDPGAALNPLMTIGSQLEEAIRLHDRSVSRAASRERTLALLEEVGISEPMSARDAYPHEFSGGMRQRVMIAMALSSDPELLICDEPTTALDVTTQARVMELIDRLANERGTAVLLITHDLGVVAGFCDRVAVMYAGQIVEMTTTASFLSAPSHPYSQALLAASLDLQTPVGTRLPSILGAPRAPRDFDEGCAFRERCPIAVPACSQGPIPLVAVDANSAARCIRIEEARS
ncbi:ABC transporter ATP-binding protein [Microbacterium sp. NC79]|uniref:ABC transporter ATP-binding protein n=1 Tax=Microbacterium sp. NC79 TaxID=2851009 RepID=UPI001C2BEE47|nr:ABC transporter ATP-binding protein [Microbacterium sp. NC79]MBV0896220.1 ABC transporter ATP-binding protein [Microbacterium sp. NC79]